MSTATMGHTHIDHRLSELTSIEPYHAEKANTDVRDDGLGIRPHPLGVRPSGNALTAKKDLRAQMGLFGRIPDQLVLTLLEWLDEDTLLRLGSTCKAFYAYTTYDQLWRDLWIAKSSEMQMEWRGSWRASSLGLCWNKMVDVDCHGLFSDALHRPFLCSQISLASYASGVPPNNRISRLKDLSVEEFAISWSDKPFVLTEPVKQWPIYKAWSEDRLLDEFGQTAFRAEAVDWPLKTYVDYMLNNDDESPLYLFDRSFVQKMRLQVGLGGEYSLPECFGMDFFELLGHQRPDHRWLIMGPARSGSTFHKDPNATSAWNAVIRGSKYWIMFPNSVIPPGVFISEDESEVTSPLSIAEWLLEFHEEARNTADCLEGICGEGELLHVPSGWWHLVVNLDNAIAITQNFVSKSHLQAAVDFLKHKPEQVSGFSSEVKDPQALFMERLASLYPDFVEGVQKPSSKKRKWEELIQHESIDLKEGPGTFNFSFESDLEDEIR